MFAAITGIIASRDRAESQYEYFTSARYPILVEEALGVGLPLPNRGSLWGSVVEDLSVALPSPVSADLQSVVAYQTYNSGLTESLSVALPTPVSANLQSVITYQTYNSGQTEDLSVALPTPVSATLPVVISYVTYNNAAAAENLSVGLPQVISGSLS